MSFEEGIKVRNNLLFWAEKFYKHWHEGDKRYISKDGEYHTFEPMCGGDKKIIHVKVFYGSRDDGVMRGYHSLCEKAYKRFLEEYNVRKKSNTT